MSPLSIGVIGTLCLFVVIAVSYLVGHSRGEEAGMLAMMRAIEHFSPEIAKRAVKPSGEGSKTKTP